MTGASRIIFQEVFDAEFKDEFDKRKSSPTSTA